MTLDSIEMKHNVLVWELVGIAFVFLVGSLLHFVFEWSGESRIVGLFASVNESVWEHFKQGFWPVCIWGAIEYGFLRKQTNNFFTAKAAAVYIIPLITSLSFYGYTAITGEEILIADILIFLVAVIIGQLTSYGILTSPRLPAYADRISIFFIIVQALVLMLFTFFPPYLPIFLDSNTGTYGIP